MKSLFNQRRDLFYLFLLIPLGIVLMLISGQFATRLMRTWNVRADMSSSVDTGDYFESSVFPNSVAPVRSDILTPMAWADSFLNPQKTNSDAAEVPFVVLDPSATPTHTPAVSPTSSPTATQPTVTATPSPSVTPSSSATPSAVPTATKKPKDDDDDPPVVTVTATASPTLPPVTSTIDPAMTQLTATPTGLNEDEPDGNNASVPDGSYFVIDLGLNPIVVNATPDGSYDLVYYEDENPNGSGEIAMDQVILGITNDPSGNTYYQIFNWGDGIPDTNTNVDTTVLGEPTAEVDNQVIQTSDLYEDPASAPPPSNSQTGILIDVDQAPSNPPPGNYQYLVIIAPPASAPNNLGDGGQVDSIDVTEVSSPAPP